MDFGDQFRAFMAQSGFEPPPAIEADGGIHRFPTNGRASDKAGWYVFYADAAIPVGMFGDWRTGAEYVWSLDGWGASLEDQAARHEAIEELKAKAAAAVAERARVFDEKAKEAEARWQAAPRASADHPYLIRKKVKPHGLRAEGDNLLIPCGRFGIGIRSLQTIGRDGRKSWMKDAEAGGGFYALGKLQDHTTIYIATGFATAATIHEISGHPAVVAFSDSNLLNIAPAIRGKYPNAAIIVCADDDYKVEGNPGLRKAREAAASIGARLAIPEFGEHRAEKATDFNDQFVYCGADAVRGSLAKVAEQPAELGEPPRPLMRSLPPPERFPVAALGEFLSNTALAIHDRAQNPVAICAQSVLAAACLAVMGHADIALPIGRVVPISLYLIALALTGERKSTGDDFAMFPIEQHEHELRAEYDVNKFEYQIKHRTWELGKEQTEKQGKGPKAVNQEELQHKLREHGPPPEPPLEPTMLTDEPTIQGLELHYRLGLPILGLFATEGGKFICGHSMADDKTKIRASTSLSNLWDGKPIRRMRAESGSLYMSGRRLAMHLQIQPEVSTVLLADADIRAQGFLSRLLIAFPETMIGGRMQRPEQENTAPRLAAYNAWMLDILRTPLPVSDERKNELRPVVLQMSEDAKDLWLGFTDAVEQQMGSGGSLRQSAALVNKIPEQAARLAAVLTLWDTKLVAKEVSAEYMVRGITLAKYYAAEAVRLNEIATTSAQLVKAEGLLEWLRTEWGEPAVCLTDVYQFGPGSIRDAAAARPLIRILEDHGWLHPIVGGAIIRGKRRRTAWSIIREAD
jgi:putative DNA primase/helicase